MRIEGTDEQVMQEVVRAVLLTAGLEFHTGPLPDVAEYLIAEIPRVMKYQGFVRSSGQYTAAGRERWRNEIREAKQTMSKEEFTDWLYRKVNTVGND